MINVFVSDLDGTLIDKNENVAEADIQAISKWQSDGNLFVVATGRGKHSIDLLKRNNIFPNYFICATGSIVFDHRGHVIHEEKFSRDILKKVIDILEAIDCCDYILDITNDDISYGKIDKGHFFEHINRSDFQCRSITDDVLEHVSIMKIFVCFKDDDLAIKYQSYFKEKFPYIDVYHADFKCLDIVVKGVSKLSALLRLMEIVNLSINNVVCIGDEENDFLMIKEAAVGFCMEKCNEKLRDVATYSVSNVADAFKVINRKNEVDNG